MLRVLFDLINGATAEEIEIIVPPPERSDISCAFVIDYGTPGRLRLIARHKAREAERRGKTQELHALWMRRLAARATKAMRAGRALTTTKRTA